jgi:hypothetical protein
MGKLRIGKRVMIVNLPDNVTDEVKAYEGATGRIKCYGSPENGMQGYYVCMDDGRHTKRFYENELQPVRRFVSG